MKNNVNQQQFEEPEKDKVEGEGGDLEVYDDDQAYMLNDNEEKDNQYGGEEDEGDHQVDQDQDDIDQNYQNNNKNNIDDMELSNEMGELNIAHNPDDDDTVRNKEDNAINTNQSKGINMMNLITLKYISVCQCCKENFNSSTNIPFLLKCGHFFCRVCLDNNYTDENGIIYCPNDGVVANSINELKVLNNLIVEKSVDQHNYVDNTNNEILTSTNRSNCEVHPTQQLSHYIEDTREVICVYCAFNKFKKNPKYEIKEIKDKCGEILTEVDKILSDNQNYVEILQTTLKEIKDNKSQEEDRVTNLYDDVIKYLQTRKNEALENINNIFVDNADKLGEKLDYFSTKMEDAEELKVNIHNVMNNQTKHINEILTRFGQFMKEANDPNKLNLELTEFKFSHDDENKLFKYLNNFGDLKSKARFIRFSSKHSGVGSGLGNYNNNNNINFPTSSNIQSNYVPVYTTGVGNNYSNLNNLQPQSKLPPNYSSNYSAGGGKVKSGTGNYNDILNTSELVNNDKDNEIYLGGGRVNTGVGVGKSNLSGTGGNKDIGNYGGESGESNKYDRYAGLGSNLGNQPNNQRNDTTNTMNMYSYLRGGVGGNTNQSHQNSNIFSSGEYNYNDNKRDLSNILSKTPDAGNKVRSNINMK